MPWVPDHPGWARLTLSASRWQGRRAGPLGSKLELTRLALVFLHKKTSYRFIGVIVCYIYKYLSAPKSPLLPVIDMAAAPLG